MAAKKKTATDPNVLHRKLVELWNRGQSKYCEVRGSEIHGRGVYATTFIPKETKVIEYVGELIDKTTSEKRGVSQHEHARQTGDAAVYIFTLSRKYDLDGNVPWNTARLINHSCAPNCEAWMDGRKIFIHSLTDINPGDELTFDYGFDVDCYEDHPCRCGKKECIGYIVSRSQWDDLAKRLETKKKTAKA
ncbi:MAG: SET domain-containing protein [Verrucomicrobiaceae bacterium]|nr:MAG: SET domain-containing protein [Verrucomicrobiaceae bacterium]